MSLFEYYTDGAASPNPGKGGWAYILVQDDLVIEQDGDYIPYTTNQRMEMMGLLGACRSSEKYGSKEGFSPNRFIIYTDSSYLANCVKDRWYVKWQSNGWVNSKKEPVANKDLWEELVPYFNNCNISIVKVKGHAGNKYNEIVDELAVSYRLG